MNKLTARWSIQRVVYARTISLAAIVVLLGMLTLSWEQYPGSQAEAVAGLDSFTAPRLVKYAGSPTVYYYYCVINVVLHKKDNQRAAKLDIGRW